MWLFSSRQPRTANHSNRRRNAFRPLLEALEGRLLPSTFTVVNTSDSGPGSLRQAIIQVNQDTQPVADTIAFAIGSGHQAIVPLSALPALTHPVVIDGTTQPGFAGTPLIELDGASAGSTADGLILSAGGSTVQGLAINRFGTDGILVAGNGNVVAGCYLGTDVTGTQALGNKKSGVEVTGAANTIGGTIPSTRNLISGQDGSSNTGQMSVGVLLQGNDNFVEGNFIGTDLTGAHGLAEPSTSPGFGNERGVVDEGTANTIGGTLPGAGNVISANVCGVYLCSSTESLVEGNFIGTDLTGTHTIPLVHARSEGNTCGVEICSPAEPSPVGGNNIVGGTTASARNIISGNSVGVEIYGAGVLGGNAGNLIEGNYIGTDVTGILALGNGNGSVGIPSVIISYPGNTVGGTAPGAGNLISANSGVGVLATSKTTIQGNRIGTDVTGTKPLGNGGGGVRVGGSSNTIGGTTPGAGNIIAFNTGDGVSVLSGTDNSIRENSIFANGGLGIDLSAANKANNLQAAPVLTSAVSANGTLTFAGTLTATANTTYTLEFFSNPSATSQGQSFLGFITVTTNSKGKATFSANFALTVALGEILTATATDPGNNTSQFSNGLAVS